MSSYMSSLLRVRNSRSLLTLAVLTLVGLSMACTTTDGEEAEDLALAADLTSDLTAESAVESDYADPSSDPALAAVPPLAPAEEGLSESVGADASADLFVTEAGPQVAGEGTEPLDEASSAADPFAGSAAGLEGEDTESAYATESVTDSEQLALTSPDQAAVIESPEANLEQAVFDDISPSEPMAQIDEVTASSEDQAVVDYQSSNEDPQLSPLPPEPALIRNSAQSNSQGLASSGVETAVDAPSESISYLVAPGDTLSEIAERIYGAASEWRTIAGGNGLSAPFVIFPGDVLTINAFGTASAFAQAYNNVPETQVTVEKGDTLFSISERLLGSGSAWKYIWKINEAEIPDPNRLRLGQVIRFRDFRGIQARR